MSANGYITDTLTRHQLLIQRMAGGEVEASQQIIDKMRLEIVAAIRSSDITPDQLAGFVKLQRELQNITEDGGSELYAAVYLSAAKFIEYEIGFTEKMLSIATTENIDTPDVTAVVDSLPDREVSLNDTDSTWEGLFYIFSAGVLREVISAILTGSFSGLSSAAIADSVNETMKTRTASQAATTIITAINSAGSVARGDVYAENAGLFDSERFVAVLDNRTTLVCAGNDSKVFPVGVGPIPPLHFNCRSIRQPIIKDEFGREIRGATRESMYGDVSSKTTYSSWLKRQSLAFQELVLGKERARLFRSGEVKLDRFTDPDGRVYTLAELRELEDITLQ